MWVLCIRIHALVHHQAQPKSLWVSQQFETDWSLVIVFVKPSNKVVKFLGVTVEVLLYPFVVVFCRLDTSLKVGSGDAVGVF